MSATAAVVVGFDPLKDKSYAATRLGRSVVDFLAWMELGGAAERTLDQYERDLARACLMYPNTGLEDFTDDDMLHVAKQFKPGERRVRVAAYRSFFKWALRRRLITLNPCDALPELKPRSQKVIDVFTDAEIESLLALPIVDAAPLAILLLGGLRKAECRHLRLRDCRPESGQIVVVQGKGGKDRIVPMEDRLRLLLNDLVILEGLNDRDYIFYSVHANETHRKIMREKPVGEGTFARWWRTCIDETGIRYRTPHTARHTFATRWRRRGLAIDEIQILLGHSSMKTTADLYVHTKVADVAERMALIEATEA